MSRIFSSAQPGPQLTWTAMTRYLRSVKEKGDPSSRVQGCEVKIKRERRAMNGRLPTDKAVTQLQLTVEESKKALREVMWEKSAILGPPVHRGDWPDALVLMPFAAVLQPIYKTHIKRVATRLNVRVGRADDFFGTAAIMQDIWSAIHGAKIVLADCTGRNPNVFYEIGLAHAIGRHTILISQSLDDVPFDLRYLRVIRYEYTSPGMRTFEKCLFETIVKSI